ncbi:MAG TPA: hypothetical protein VF587_10215 [Solirubrobacteraceae bacterium]|jgi:hypothetical protein
MKFDPDSNGVFKLWLNSEGPLEEEVIAAGHLRQGKSPSMVAMVLGYGLFEILRPRRSKKLPRHFVLALTPSEIVAFKASAGGGGAESSTEYHVNMSEEVAARYPRAGVTLTDLGEKGEKSQGGILTIDGESFPVARPNMNGDPNTDELFAVLSQAHTTLDQGQQNAGA